MRRLAALFLPLFCVLTAAIAQADEPRSARIVNGLLTHAYPSTGALLFGSSPDSATLACTGTMIGCDHFLTAAHCVCDFSGPICQPGQAGAPDPGNFLVFLQHAGFVSVSSIELPSSYSFPENDIAVLRLSSEVNGVAPSQLPSAKPSFGTSGTIAGYGRSGGGSQDFGLKRRGAVVTQSCTGGISNTLSVCWDFAAPVGPPGGDSNTCNGDSGGPLFVDEGGELVVAGVTSGGTSPDCLSPDDSYDTNVSHYLSFINGIGGADLLNTTCGSLPQVGGAAVAVQGFSGPLSGGLPEGRHSFQVGPDSEMLRVAMNADETGGNDFDLYVRFGAAPTTAEFDCRAFGGNSWGFCEFPSPAEGTWHVLVNLFSGSGTYQATATVFGEAEPPPPPPPPLPDGAQTESQRKCLDGLAKAGSKVAKAGSKAGRSCIQAFADGDVDALGAPGQTQTAQACLANDVKSRVVRAEQKTLRKDQKNCLAFPDQMPEYAYVGGDPVNVASMGGSGGLLADVFGPDLDAVLATEAALPEEARCQAEAQKRIGKLYDTAAREATKAQKKSLAGIGGFAIVTSEAELTSALDGTLQGDPKGRIAKAEVKLLASLAKHCAAAATPLASLFPGCAAPDVNALTSCARAAAVCRACQAVEGSSGLDLDCDLADDALTNTSCP